MEITTLSVDERRRKALAEYRDSRNLPNMDAALAALLDETDGNV